MKLNPKHHNPELLEKIDEYYDARNSYQFDDYENNQRYFDSCWSGDDTYAEPDWVIYYWLTNLDRVTTIQDDINEVDGCTVYEVDDVIEDYEIYSYSSVSKHVGFFGAVLKAFNGTKNPSPKLKRIVDAMIDRYPEIYIKLMGVV